MLALAWGLLPCSGDARAQNPVLPGDHPDPSVIRVGRSYWTASTSGDWSPQFPLYRSDDLHHWVAAGSIFPQQPAWATGSFWAPELVYDGGRVLVYYVGRKRDGPLCVAVATAPKPGGPYTDHGPLMCQPDGSIDPAFARDEHGTPYLIWKEDGNSIGKPTPLWAQPLTPDLLQLTGNKTELLENEPAGWEGGVMEAPYILRHGGMFYLFYAGNGCCGVGCRYAEGVARAAHLLGPYTRDPANPIIAPNANWRCPGHGSAVQQPDGTDYFLYHAYPAEGSVYLGRETVLDRIAWNADGWPSINAGHGPSGAPAEVAEAVHDDFRSTSLAPEWRWRVNHRVSFHTGGGRLTLTVAEGDSAVVARSLPRPDYRASVTLAAGTGALAVAGGAHNLVALGRRQPGGALELWQQTQKGVQVLWKGDDAATAPQQLQVVADNGGKRLVFRFRDGAKAAEWTAAGEPVDVTPLPQWDEGLRIGLLVSGPEGQSATFRSFALVPDDRR